MTNAICTLISQSKQPSASVSFSLPDSAETVCSGSPQSSSQVNGLPGEDAGLQCSVERAILDSGYCQLGGVEVCVKHGIVRLEGQVHSWYMKLIAQEVARKVPGVIRLTNAIKVSRS